MPKDGKTSYPVRRGDPSKPSQNPFEFILRLPEIPKDVAAEIEKLRKKGNESEARFAELRYSGVMINPTNAEEADKRRLWDPSEPLESPRRSARLAKEKDEKDNKEKKK